MMEDVGTSANKLIQLDSNGKIPAVDGSLLTGMSSALSGASDPTISTNPSGGVGTKYKNTTSGEMYICTDASAGENVWTNVGPGSGDVKLWQVGRSIAGYAAGGYGSGSPSVITAIDRYSFASDVNATDHGDTEGGSDGDRMGAGASSDTHGYLMGTKQGGDTNKVTKFAFAGSSVTTAIHGTLRQTVQQGAGNHSETHGFYSGGETVSQSIRIDKIAFAGDSVSAVAHGELSAATRGGMGSGNQTHGFIAGGQYSNVYTTIIKTFSYASNTTSSSHGDLTVARNDGGGYSSSTDGYASGGWTSAGPNPSNVIDKFSFSSNVTATDHGDLTSWKTTGVGSSSTTHGYTAGGDGYLPGVTSGSRIPLNIIDKFAYASAGNATDVGDLTQVTYQKTGHQY